MRLAAATRLFASNAMWRATGSRKAGRALVHALGSKDDDLRTIAGMLLARAGERAEPLLKEALDKRENLSMVLTILGDIGGRKFESDLEEFSRDADPKVAKAAQDALRVLQAQRKLAPSR